MTEVAKYTPDVKIPGVTMPDVKVPNMPDIKLPDIKTPEFKAPDVPQVASSARLLPHLDDLNNKYSRCDCP